MTAFPEPQRFAELYPEMPGVIGHALAGHPMFELDALVALAATMRPETLEYNRGDLPLGVDPDAIPGNGLTVEETIRGIEQNGSWMVLKYVEHNAAYRALLEDSLADLKVGRGRDDGRDAPARILRLHIEPRLGHAAALRSRTQHPAATARARRR